MKQFDLMVHNGPNGNPGFTDYLHEPDRRLSEVDCDLEVTQCKSSWLPNVRLDDISFTPSKAIRLAFHDCQPYIDGTGGCDGCINFEENVLENDVLQHSVAILVSFERPLKGSVTIFCCRKNFTMNKTTLKEHPSWTKHQRIMEFLGLISGLLQES